MPLKIYLDDDVASHTLKELLQHASFQVKNPADADLLGRQDAVHLEYAKKNGYALLTKNASDYLALHEKDPRHAGIIVIYQDNDVRRDMGFKDIVAALKQIVKLRIPLTRNFVILNHYKTAKQE